MKTREALQRRGRIAFIVWMVFVLGGLALSRWTNDPMLNRAMGYAAPLVLLTVMWYSTRIPCGFCGRTLGLPVVRRHPFTGTKSYWCASCGNCIDAGEWRS
jgi:hypothetical protein